jgi:hypothetical protein
MVFSSRYLTSSFRRGRCRGQLNTLLAGESRSNESRKRPIHAGFADSNFLHTLKYTPMQKLNFIIASSATD